MADYNRPKQQHKIMDFYKFLAGPSKSGFKELEKWKVKKICFHFYPRSEKWIFLAFRVQNLLILS